MNNRAAATTSSDDPEIRLIVRPRSPRATLSSRRFSSLVCTFRLRSSDLRRVFRGENRRGQFRQSLEQLTGVGGHFPEGGRGPDVLHHPLFHERLCGFPEIELRVELPAEPFDVEQGFLQQHQLWLHLHVELASGLKELDQKVAERDLVQRLGEDRLADFLNHALERVRVRALGNPAGFEMQSGHLPVVPIEEGEQVLSPGSPDPPGRAGR